jgi:hypothetical protein
VTRGTAGKFGFGISFDGTNGAVIVPASASLDMLTAGTLELWLRLSSTGTTDSVLSRGTGVNDSNILLTTSCGDVTAVFTQGTMQAGAAGACGALMPSVWRHVAVVNDGSMLTLYINASAVTTMPGGDLGALTSALYIGLRQPGVLPLHGDLDEIKWWTIARSSFEVCTDAGGTATPFGCSLP